MGYREEAIECVKDRVLPIHQQIYAKYNGDFDRIYSEGYNSKSYQGRVIEPGKVYELSYLECSCPKVKCGIRSNPEQCECSRQSILFILSQLEPDSRFDVQIENTILRGGDRCTFRITRRAGMKRLIAICGLDCEKCDAYIATKNNDQALREKTAKLWSELNQAPSFRSISTARDAVWTERKRSSAVPCARFASALLPRDSRPAENARIMALAQS